jgi:hypothetical protein
MSIEGVAAKKIDGSRPAPSTAVRHLIVINSRLVFIQRVAYL